MKAAPPQESQQEEKAYQVDSRLDQLSGHEGRIYGDAGQLMPSLGKSYPNPGCRWFAPATAAGEASYPAYDIPQCQPGC